MYSLEKGVNSIRLGDFKLLSNFIGEPATPENVKKICKGVAISDICLNLIKEYPREDALRQSILLAIAATKSEDFFNEIMYGFRITIRSSGEIRTNCYVDIDGYTVIHLIESWNADYQWDIQFLHPILFNEDYRYATEAVLKLCR